MNWGAVGAIGEIVGALAVIATLVYLAQQVRLSNRIAFASSEIELKNSFSPVNEAVYGNTEIAQLLSRAINPDAEFEDAEKFMLIAWFRQLFHCWHAIECSYRNGLASKSIYESVFDDIRITIEQVPGTTFALQQLVEDYPSLSSTKIVVFLKESLNKYQS